MLLRPAVRQHLESGVPNISGLNFLSGISQNVTDQHQKMAEHKKQYQVDMSDRQKLIDRTEDIKKTKERDKQLRRDNQLLEGYRLSGAMKAIKEKAKIDAPKIKKRSKESRKQQEAQPTVNLE